MDLPVLDRLDDLADLVEGELETYVRFSDGPEDDRHRQSIDYESGLPLPGLSANRLNPAAWWTRPLTDWLARQICQYSHLQKRSSSHRGWVTTGVVVDVGPDDEPLLTEVRPLAWLSPELLAEAERRYQERFDQGRSAK